MTILSMRLQAVAAGLLCACLSSGLAAAETATLQGFLRTAIESGRANSAIAMLARDDEILWLGTVGEIGRGVPRDILRFARLFLHGGYAILWIDAAARLIAYFAFPVMPPGDQELLMELRRLVYQAIASGVAAVGT